MKVIDYLASLSGYPVPGNTIEAICLKRQVSAGSEYQPSSEIKGVEADVYAWLALAPDVTQGGITYSLTDEQRAAFRSKANALYASIGDEEAKLNGNYGYQGSRL